MAITAGESAHGSQMLVERASRDIDDDRDREVSLESIMVPICGGAVPRGNLPPRRRLRILSTGSPTDYALPPLTAILTCAHLRLPLARPTFVRALEGLACGTDTPVPAPQDCVDSTTLR